MQQNPTFLLFRHYRSVGTTMLNSFAQHMQHVARAQAHLQGDLKPKQILVANVEFGLGMHYTVCTFSEIALHRTNKTRNVIIIQSYQVTT